VLAAFALFLLMDPVPAQSDLQGFSILGLALVLGFVALVVGAERARWWHWWLAGAWVGLAVGALTLAYKDTLVAELRFFGPVELAWQMLLHVLIAPIELFFGFVIGFEAEDAPLYVLACVLVTLLGAELIRRRLWPRRAASTRPVEN
jgi:hypothetical protein